MIPNSDSSTKVGGANLWTIPKYCLVLYFIGFDPNELISGEYPIVRAAAHGDLIEIRKLVEWWNADIDVVDPYNGRTALINAIKERNWVIVNYVLELNPASVNQVDINGRSALFYAAEERNYEICQALLEAGADTSVVDDHNMSPIMHPIM